MVINMKNNVKLNENNSKVSNIGHCAFPEEIMHEKVFCFAANGTGNFENKQPVTISNGKLIPANIGGWKLSTYSDLMKSLEENPQVKTQIHNPAVGFLCPPEYVVLDIDGHGKEGLSDAKKDFVSRYAETTYCEKSLSGNGYHMIFRCDSPITSGKINVDFGEGLNGIEVFGGLECKIHVILTGNSNGKEISHLPDELREKIKEATKNRDSTKQKTFYSGICNESAILLAKIDKNPVDIYCELFEGKIEDSKSHKETRCVTNMFDKKFGLNAHHFGVKNNGEWCLYGNDMKGGSLLEAVAVVEGLYDFDEGKIKDQRDIPKIRKITKERFNIPEENTITIEGLHEIQKQVSESRSIYKPYYPQVKNELPALIRDFVEAVSLKSDAYPEYSIVNMLFIGSLITCGNAKYISPFAFNNKSQPISFRSFILGQSSVSRKSTALKHARGLLDEIKTKWSTKKYGKNIDSRMIITGETFPTDLGNINSEARLCQDFAEKSNQYLINDEFGSILKTLKKDYNGNLRDYLCMICDNTTFHKKLKKERGQISEYHILNPIFNSTVASTPETFASYAAEDDATSGYLYRFLFCCPSYSRKMKSTKEIIKNSEEAHDIVDYVSDVLGDIMLFFESKVTPVTYSFSEKCIDFFDEWVQKRYKTLNNEKQFSLQARFESYIFDIAVILHILSERHTINTIDLQTFQLAAELIDGLFRPSGEFMLDSTMQDDLNKLMGLCKKHSANGQPIPHTKLLHYSHFDKNKFDVLINTLIDSAKVVRREIPSNNRKTAYEYIWVDFTN